MSGFTKIVLLTIVFTFAIGCFGSANSQGLACDVTPTVRATAPSDPNADQVGPSDWYVNSEETLWAGPVIPGGWRTGGEKTYWVRPRGTDLLISGYRLDSPQVKLTAEIPCCYPTGFQIVGLNFPTAGCWDVRATSGDAQLHFVTLVRDGESD